MEVDQEDQEAENQEVETREGTAAEGPVAEGDDLDDASVNVAAQALPGDVVEDPKSSVDVVGPAQMSDILFNLNKLQAASSARNDVKDTGYALIRSMLGPGYKTILDLDM